jgi:hypothetical protein
MVSPQRSSERKTRLVNTLGFRPIERWQEMEMESCDLCLESPCMAPEPEMETTLVNTLTFRKKKGSHG